MGQQRYEEQVACRAPAALGEGWSVRRAVVRSLRSSVAGNRRLPAGLLSPGSGVSRRLAGVVLYPGSGLVHRMDLRLPPAIGPEVITVHDAVAWRFPDEAPLPRSVVAEARRARAVVCPSEFAADEVATVLGVRSPVVLPNGVDDDLFDVVAPSEDELRGLGVRPPYVLHASGCTLRKNLAALAGAWSRVRSAHATASLVLLGPPDARRDALFAGLEGAVRLGRVTDSVRVSLIGGAEVVVVPSVYEGFGLPALEAMAAGVPVVAADRAALPEVCGGAAVLVAPTAEAIATGIIDVLRWPGAERQRAIEAGRTHARSLTWDRCVAGHAELWRRFA